MSDVWAFTGGCCGATILWWGLLIWVVVRIAKEK